MNKLILGLCFLLSSTFIFAGIKVGKIDVQKVVLSVNQGKAVDKKLKAEFGKKQKILQKDEANARKLQENFEKQRLVMNDKAKQKKLAEIQGAVVAFQKKKVAFQSEIQELERSLKSPIFEKIKKIIEEVSSKNKLDLTFEGVSSGILYAKNNIDLTSDVIKLYNKKHK